MSRKRLIYGWGINDVDYEVTINIQIGGKSKQLWICPYYEKWRGIIRRCHSKKFKSRRTSYEGCSIDVEWKYFSNFIKWVDSQPNRDWQNCEPDKDLLVRGNKHYSSATCIFVPEEVNVFVIDSKKARGPCLIGTTPNSGKFRAQCSNAEGTTSTSKRGYIGLFDTELEAHKAWQAKKHEYALRLADKQTDAMLAKLLQERYAPDKDWTKA